jgi:hypothetical protein
MSGGVMRVLICFLVFGVMLHAENAFNSVKTIKVSRAWTKEARQCIECHSKETPGMVADWKNSRHGHVGVSCLDCHGQEEDSPMAAQNCPGVKGTKIFVSPLVSPNTCKRCHPKEFDDFSASGHYRAYKQYVPKENLHTLIQVHEGQNHPKHKKAGEETGCMQCHGSEIKLDENKRPTKETWPNAGMGSVYPDGAVGNCVACHTRHTFSIAEARHPRSCASCHLGPDHPNIEIFENSKHGHIFLTSGKDYKMDSAPDTWEPGDYRAPTCAVCHMSGIGELDTTHNISERLKWNLWAKESKLRNSPDPMSPLTGNWKEGREKMKSVCGNCHSERHTKNYFEQSDGMVHLYNDSYWKPAKKMHDDLKAKGLLKENPWDDEFQKVFYHLWHHEGRRARQGAAMGAPDWAHWHGVFELQQDIYKLKNIYNKRLKTGKIE